MVDVSIIIPVYKVEKFIKECIERTINQTFKNIEIILVDDGSPDNSGKICDEYARLHDRVRVIHQKNQGVCVARNRGIAEANGKWIIFIDADDYPEKDMVEKLYKSAEQNNCDIVFGNYHYVTKKNKQVKKMLKSEGKIFQDEEKIILFKRCMGNLGVPWGKIYRKDLLIDNKIKFKEGLKKREDSLFNLYAFKKSEKIEYIEDVIYNYRQNMDSSCYKYTDDIIETAEVVLIETSNFLKYFDLEKELELEYNNTCMKLLIEILKYIPNECQMPYLKKIKQIKKILEKEPYTTARIKSKFSGLNLNYKIGFLLIKIRFINLLYLYYKSIYKLKQKINYKSKEEIE